MAHVNQQVREKVRDLLVDTDLRGLFTNRGPDLLDEHLPAGVIGTSTDEVQTRSKDVPPKEKRTVSVTVALVVDGDAQDLDDQLDRYRVQVESRMVGDLGGLVHRLEHTGADLDMGADEEGERWYAFYVLSWEVDVWTIQGDPETAL